jgi:hypothetical protein
VISYTQDMITIRALLFAIVVGVTVSAAAQEITFTPQLPTSDDSVSARIDIVWPNGCSIEPRVSLPADQVIRIELTSVGETCPSVVREQVVSTRLGYLQPGLYSVELFVDGSIYRAAGLRVLDANPPLTMTLNASPERGGYDVSIITPQGLCSPSVCPLSVMFGDVPAAKIRRGNDFNWLIVTVPPHPAGTVDVVVTSGSYSVTAPRAFVYFSESAPPDFGLFEPVLFPLLARSSGRGGTQWDTDAVLVNNSSERPMIMQYPLQIPEPTTLPRHHRVTVEKTWPRGMIWLPLRTASPSASASLTVRETTRGHAFELPVVREREFAPLITIAGLPRDPRKRMLLRVYSFDEPYPLAPQDVSVFVSGLTTNIPQGSAKFELTHSRNDEPWYASLDLGTIRLDSVGAPDREDQQLKVEVSSWPHRIWAFVSIVDNETQETRIVTPVK